MFSGELRGGGAGVAVPGDHPAGAVQRQQEEGHQRHQGHPQLRQVPAHF